MRIAEHDPRAHVDQTVDEEQPAFVHLLVNQHRPGDLRRKHQRDADEVGGKAGPGRVIDLRNRAVMLLFDPSGLLRRDHHVVAIDLDFDAQPPQHDAGHGQIPRSGVVDPQGAARGRRQPDEAADLEKVRADAVPGAVQPLDPVDGQHIAPESVDRRAHSLQQAAELPDMRFAGSVQDGGPAGGQHGAHDGLFGARDRRLIEEEFGTFQPARALQHERVAGEQLGAEAGQGEQVGVDPPPADAIAAGAWHGGPSGAGEQRRGEQEGAPDLRGQVAVEGAATESVRPNRDGVGIVALNSRAQLLRDGQHRPDIEDVGHVLQHDLVGGQEGCRDRRQGLVLVARRGDAARQSPTSCDPERFGHANLL